MHSFLQVLAAHLPALLKAASSLGSTADGVLDMQKVFQQAATQQSWVGQSSNAQQSRASTWIDTTGKFASQLMRAQAQTAAGAGQMQAAQAVVQATVTAAKSAGFLVLPGGVVRLSHWQVVATSDKPHARAALERAAAAFTKTIQAGMKQSAAADAQTAAALIEIATQYMSQLFQKDSSAGASTLPPVELPPGGPVSSTPVEIPRGTPLPALSGGSGLGPIDPSGGGGGGLAGAGAGGLGGASALGGAGSLGGINGAGGLGAAGALGAGGGLVGAAGAGRGGSGYGGAPMAPMGHGAGARDGEHAGRKGFLQEDEDPWEAGDAPDGVLS